MIRSFRQISVRALCLLAVFGLFAAATPGCDDSAKKTQEGGTPVPANVKESNSNMENFMKSQQKAK